jgi:hypothetical protein
MSTLTDIGHCKKHMTAEGWALFCAHRKTDPLSPFDPATCTDAEEILLSNLEVHQYEYRKPVEPSTLLS